MEKTAIEDVEPTAMGDGNVDRRGLSEPLATSDLALNRYVLDPGEAFSGKLHAHLDQEEVFYVMEGTATFETKAAATDDSQVVEIGADEAIRFAPGEFQQGRNESDEQVVALALGAPTGSSDVRVLQPCPECDSDVLAMAFEDGEMVAECPDCGARPGA